MGRGDGGSKEKGGEEPGESFADLLDSDVQPLPDRPEPRVGRRPPIRKRTAPATKTVFEIEREGEEFFGRAPGVSKADLRRIEGESPEGVVEIDLHGLTRAEARTKVLRALGQARKQGRRWLHVIHGWGKGSGGDAVLKRSLPGWLAEPPHGAAVLGFVCSRRLPGATGATRIWLRREGPGAPGAR